MEVSLYKTLFDLSPVGFAYQRVVYDSFNIPVDLEFIEVNPAFEALSGKDRSSIVGGLCSNVFPFLVDESPDCLKSIAEMVEGRGQMELVREFPHSGKSYKVMVESAGGGCFSSVYIELEGNTHPLSSSGSPGMDCTQKERDSLFLNKLSLRLAELPTAENVIPTLLSQLKKHTGAVMAIFNIYDREKNVLRVQSVDVDGAVLKAAIIVAGKKIFSTESPVSPAIYSEMLREKVGVGSSLHEMTFGAIPDNVDKSIRSMTGICSLYSVAHVIAGELYGTTMLAFKDSKANPSRQMLESFAYLAALSLRRNKAEKDLVTSEDHLRRLTNNICDVVFTTDLHLRPNYISPSIKKLTGETPEEHIAKTIDQRHPPESMEIIDSVFKQELKSEREGLGEKHRTRVVELEYYTADGGVVPVSMHLSFVRDGKGKATGIQGVVRDISEQKRMELELREKEEKLRTILQTIPDLIFHMDRNGRFLNFFQPHFAHALLRMPEDFINKSVFEFFDSTLADRIQYAITSTLYSGVAELEYELTMGEQRYYFARFAKLNDNEVLAVVSDVSKLKRIEMDLSHRVQFERALSESATALLQGVPNAVDMALANILSVSEACRVYLFENFTDFDGDLCIRQLNEVCLPGIDPQIDNPMLQHVSYQRDGAARWLDVLPKNEIIVGNIADFPEEERYMLEPQGILSILAIPIFVSKTWFGFVGFDYTRKQKAWNEWDINLLKTASEMLGVYFRNKKNEEWLNKQNQELTQSNLDKDRFVQVLAHDLKNPFSTLLGFSDLLLRNFNDYNNDDLKEFVQLINQTAKTTYSLLDELLLWSRVRLGRVTFTPVKTSASEICNDVVAEFKPAAQRKSISLTFNVQDNLYLIVDRNMLKTILRNLVSNALKFTSENGSIIVSIREDRDVVRLVVSDNGVGISPENMEKLWNPALPFTTKGTAKEKGTGLGLLICMEFAQRHRGSIWAESPVDADGIHKGSSFVVELPYADIS